MSTTSITDEDEEFDPMAKDFNDPVFNSYKSGVGSYINPKLQTQKRREGVNQDYKLYVSDIPLGINNAGLQNIFSGFGRVTDFFLSVAKSGKCKFGFISYKTLREAERAIYNVNKVPPLNLRVIFAKTEEAKANRDEFQFEAPSDALETLKPEQPTPLAPRGMARGVLLTTLDGMRAETMPCNYVFYTPWFPPHNHHTSTSEWNMQPPDEVLDQYNETLNYEKPVIKKGKKYLMYMGRGYAIKDLIHHSEKYQPPTQQTYSFCNEDSLEAVDGYKKNKCSTCKQTAMRICFNCTRWFCSKQCHRNNAPNHTIDNTGVVICHNLDKKVEVTNERPVYVKKLIFPPTNDSVYKHNSDSDDDHCHHPLSNRNSHLNRTHYIVETARMAENVKENTVSEGDSKLVERSNLENCETDSRNSLVTVIDGEVPSDTGLLPFNTYSKVKVSIIDEKRYFYVNPLSIWDEFMEMTAMLNMIGPTTEHLSNPAVDQLCINNYDQFWCRARVTKLKPLAIFYIDYGNSEVLDNTNDLRTLPTMMHTHRFPPMCVRIMLSEASAQCVIDSLPQSRDISVKPVHVVKGIELEGSREVVDKEMYSYRAVIEGEQDDLNNSSSSSISSSIDNISLQDIEDKSGGHLLSIAASKKCKVVELVVSAILSSSRICATLALKHVKYLGLEQIEQQVSKSFASSTTSIEDDVEEGRMIGCLTHEGLHARGYISSRLGGSTRVALVDYGYVARVVTTCSIPLCLQTAPHQAVSVVFSLPSSASSPSSIKVGNKIKCSVVSASEDFIECKIEGFGRCELLPWKPRLEDSGLSQIHLETGSKVRLSSFSTPQALYVQSLDNKHKEMLDTLLQDVATYAQLEEKVLTEPEMGEVVCALYPEDQNYYRAQVYRKKHDLYSVRYLDFGNSYDIPASDMKPLPDQLKMVPCCAVKIGLKNVNESILTAQAVFYLNNLSSSIYQNQHLYLEYEEAEGDLGSCVLKTMDGQSVNQKLNQFISLNWVSCLESGEDPTNGEVFYGYDLKYIKWSSDSVMKLLLLTKHSTNSYLVINTSDSMLHYMREYYTPRVRQYCNTFSKHYQYLPRLKEICFVKHDDDWYRAVCTQNYDVYCWVVLVDFGNRGEISYKNIRPMTYEFMQTPSILKKCYIQGLPEVCKDEKVEKELNEILVAGSTHEVTVVDEKNQGVVTARFHSIPQHILTSLAS